MKSKNELKEHGVKNVVCYYFDGIINGSKINFSNILWSKKLYQIISVYNISYKSPAGLIPWCIRFNKVDECIISLEGKIKHLVLFDYGLLDKICDKIKILVSKKVVLQTALFIILERCRFIHIILCLLEKC